jgi:glutathione S-transferase
MGYTIDADRYPKLAAYLRDITATDPMRKALDDEKPFIARLGLDRSFLDRG